MHPWTPPRMHPVVHAQLAGPHGRPRQLPICMAAHLGVQTCQVSSHQLDSQAVTFIAHTLLQASLLGHETQLVHLVNYIGHLTSTLVPARDSCMMGPSDGHDTPDHGPPKLRCTVRPDSLHSEHTQLDDLTRTMSGGCTTP